MPRLARGAMIEVVVIYFGQDGQWLVILLIGGTKKRQQRDNGQAKASWQDYKQRKEGSQSHASHERFQRHDKGAGAE